MNGLALCAIHHLAFDRNLLGIDPEGVVHIAGRLLFHGAPIAVPRRAEERPDRVRLETRFARFVRAAA